MVLIGLLSVGVGLALDAYAERSNKNQTDQEERQRLEDICGIVSPESSRKQQEEDAFKELQKYANFQNDLSARVMDEISVDQMHAGYFNFPHDINDGNTNLFLRSLSTRPFDLQPENRLPYPIFIPQNISEYGRLGWTRTYVPNLMECGIQQQSFLRFIESFNKSLEFSSWLEPINISVLTRINGREDSSADLASALLAASRLLKSRPRRDTFLEIANSTMFSHRGLIAMVLTFQPDNSAQIVSIDTSPAAMSNQIRPANRSGYQTNNRFRQMGTFVSEYTDLRPSFRRETAVPSHIEPRLTNTHSNTTPLRSLISAVAKNRARKRRQKSVTSRQTLRSKRNECSSEKSQFESAAQLSSRPQSPRSENDFNLEPGAMYLVIMNDPDSQTANNPWPTNSDRTAWDHDSKAFGNFDKQTNVATDKERGDSIMGSEIAPPPAYTPGTASRSYINWMED